MKAIAVLGPNHVEVVERPAPEPDGGALVRVERTGICGTDLKVLHGALEVDYPLIMGHEMVGIVERPGPLGLVEAGTRVMVDPATSCGHCDLCRQGHLNLCRNGGLVGRDSDGFFRRLVAVAEQRLHVIPDAISIEAASLMQVLGTCVHAQQSVGVFPDQTAVVVGLGVSGMLHLQLLRARGVRNIIGVTRSQWKLDLARELGATEAVVPDEAADAVAELTGGRGADVVVEAAGTEATLAHSIELAGATATVVVFGTISSGSQGLPYYDLYFKELTLKNPRAATPDDYDRGIRLTAAGRLDPGPLLTHLVPADRPDEAFAAMDDSRSLKVAIDFESAD
jgi:2-desacetyl-2-hydroxyethyl bacteriochlorophyllide A dehydrogenase